MLGIALGYIKYYKLILNELGKRTNRAEKKIGLSKTQAQHKLASISPSKMQKKAILHL